MNTVFFLKFHTAVIVVVKIFVVVAVSFFHFAICHCSVFRFVVDSFIIYTAYALWNRINEPCRRIPYVQSDNGIQIHAFCSYVRTKYDGINLISVSLGSYDFSIKT